MKHIISDSSGLSLHLTPEEHKAFVAERVELFKKYYRIERADRGIFASNQNRYVKTREELNEYDSTYMEDLIT